MAAPSDTPPRDRPLPPELGFPGLPPRLARDLAERRSIKVQIPVRQHLQLQALRITTGEGISDLVETALDQFFDRVRAERKAAAGADPAAAAAEPQP